MLARSIIMLLTAGAFASACAQAGGSDRDIASRIESQVAAADSTLKLAKYARFYAHQPGDQVTGIYLFANEGYEPIVGKAGTSTWTSPGNLPVVYDGGCSVLLLTYDTRAGKLTSLECDASEVVEERQSLL